MNTENKRFNPGSSEKSTHQVIHYLITLCLAWWNQVKFLEQVLREGYAHPSVNGMIMWAAWHAKGCYVMCLTDNSFKNLPVGTLVDKLIAEWKTHKTAATTGADGAVELDLPHGDYNLTVSHPSLGTNATVRAMTVDAAPLASERLINIKV